MTESEENQQDILIPTSPSMVSSSTPDDTTLQNNSNTSEINVCPICFKPLTCVGQHQIWYIQSSIYIINLTHC